MSARDDPAVALHLEAAPLLEDHGHAVQRRPNLLRCAVIPSTAKRAAVTAAPPEEMNV